MVASNTTEFVLDRRNGHSGSADHVSGRTFGVIKIEHRSLRKKRTRATVRSVSWISFELRRTTLVGFSQQRNCRLSDRHCRRKIERKSENHTLHRLAVRK